jgi:hypothetical protein
MSRVALRLLKKEHEIFIAVQGRESIENNIEVLFWLTYIAKLAARI